MRGWLFVVAAAALVGAAYVFGRPLLLLLGMFALALPLISLVLIGVQRVRLEVRRTFAPGVAVAGHSTMVTLVIRNLDARGVAASIWQDRFSGHPGSVVGNLGSLRGALSASADPGTRARVSYEIVPPRRGRFELGPLTITSADPFGLATCTQPAGHAETVVVVPDAAPLPRSGLAIAEADGATRLALHRSTAEDHDTTTRGYRIGDSLRRVHWRASAHHGSLMVRQEEQRSHAEAHLLLDTQRSGYSDVASTSAVGSVESDRFEWAVEFTSALVTHLQEAGFLVKVHETAAAQLASVENRTLFLESLATIDLNSRPGPLPQIGSAHASSSRRGSLFVIVSDANDEVLLALAAARTRFDLAVAFIVVPGGERTVSELERTGWTCVVVGEHDTPRQAWLAVASAAGGHRAQ